jgi:hypothetical protein
MLRTAQPGLACLGVFLLLTLGLAQVRTIDTERELSTRFGFTPAEMGQVRSGQPVVRLLPSNDSTEVGVFGVVRINEPPDRLVYWLKDVASFRKAAELGLSRRLSDPPEIGDFAGLALDAGELEALQSCRPGKCDLQLGDKAIQRFQAGVDWTSPDAGRQANLLVRQLLLGHGQAYLEGGDNALGAYHNEKTPRVAAEQFRQILWQSKNLYDLAPQFAAYLEGFPTARLPGAEQFLYWAKGGVGPEASITLHQLVIYRATGGEVFVADKQLYASRYSDAAMAVISLATTPDGAGYYALVGARARSTMLSGVAARLLRGRVESATRDTTKMYLEWIRQSLSAGR